MWRFGDHLPTSGIVQNFESCINLNFFNGVAIRMGKLTWESMGARHFVNELLPTDLHYEESRTISHCLFSKRHNQGQKIIQKQ